MKVIGARESLLDAAQLASVAVPARSTKPILYNLKAVADGDRFTLMATDLEQGVRFMLHGVTVAEPGEALLRADRFVSILRESHDDTLTVEADDAKALVHTSSGEFEMTTEDPAGFPDIPTLGGETYHELAAGELREMIRRTAFAAAKESAKYAMTGVLWDVDGETATLVATDSRRLALTRGSVRGGTPPEKGQSYLVPTKVMSLLERHLNGLDDDSPVRVSLRPSEVLFETEGSQATVYSRLVEGRFPPYRDIIPKKHTVKVALQVEPFLSAVRQAAIMTESDSKRVKFSFGLNSLKLEATESTGRSKVQTRIEYDGDPLEVFFDPQNVVEMLRVLSPDAPLTLELVDGARPAVFRSGPNYIYLVMPMS